ncbi:unnamed protein product [Durusdinium trenchii]|uniref:Uncharacterized protein n=1 Tax=Durusdinium trenchii TaxID=1381693 RepID=A0ABP0HEY8_9DINO
MKRPSATAKKAFDAATFANRFRYGEFGDAVVFTEARRSAVLSKKPRILKWSMTKTGKNSKTPLLVVHYISEMYGQRRPFEDQVPLWSLRQMVDFSHALGSTGTRRTRSSASVPSADAVSARCPPLWWSLALWAFAEFARGSSGKGKGAKWPPESPAEPVSIPGDFPKLLYTVLHGGAQGQSERQADGISADGSPLVVWEDLRVEGERSGFPKELPGTEEKRHPTGRKLPAPSTPAFAGLLGNAQERIGKEEGKEPLPSFAKDALSVFSDLSI